MNLLGLALAFVAGGISITSPCCLPLLPGYLGYLTGVSDSAADQNRRRVVSAALLFVAGFSIVFIALGATASELGALLLFYRLQLFQIAGVFILIMGLILLLEGRIGLLSRGGDWSRGWGRGQLWAALPLGASFAITWTPCIGPVLGAILTLAGSTGDLTQGVALLAAYSLGLAIPFLLLSLSVPAFSSFARRFRRTLMLVQSGSGLILVSMGLLLVTGRWLPLMAPILSWYAKARWPPV